MPVITLENSAPPVSVRSSDRTTNHPPTHVEAGTLYAPWQPRPATLFAEMGYFSEAEGKPFTCMYDPLPGTAKQNCTFALIPTPIHDARQLPAQPNLEEEGFALWYAPSTVPDFRDELAVTHTYYKETGDLVRAATGASSVIVFDHQIRQREAGRPALGFGRKGDGSNPGAVGRVHVDYSEESGRKRLDLVLKDQATSKPLQRFAIINVWRSIKGPVLDTPLAVCDARSINVDDLAACEIRYQDRSGEIYLLRHSSRHRWFYYPAMNRDEALLFKQYDSQINGTARFTPHAAFDHPAANESTPLRESIELRCLAIFN